MHRKITQHFDQNDRNVITSTVVVGHFDKLRCCQFKIGRKHLQGHLDFFTLNHIIESVRTEQINITDLDRIVVNFGLDRWINPQRPRDQILVLRKTRVLGADHAAINLFLQERMVAGQGNEFVAAQAVARAVEELGREAAEGDLIRVALKRAAG